MMQLLLNVPRNVSPREYFPKQGVNIAQTQLSSAFFYLCPFNLIVPECTRQGNRTWQILYQNQ
jgi:hypothetical protein